MKTIKNLFIAILCVVSLPMFAQQTISGVTMPKTVSQHDVSLKLNGAGLREKLWIDLYVAGLYVKTPSTDAKTLINNDEAMSIQLEIVSGLITSEKMIAAIEEGFNNSTNGKTEALKAEIADFIDAFSDPIVKGNKFTITYLPRTGVVVTKNGKVLKTINGFEFKKALFGIWLGEKPADKKLKAGLLGTK